jgi:membrane complex biogenesis BtpA family protein
MSLSVFSTRPFVGMVHLLPLPGNPVGACSLDEVRSRAVDDANTLVAAGVDALIVENYGDSPFSAGPVAPYTVAAMTAIVEAVRAVAPNIAVGVNVLRNDAVAALSIAAVTGADFIRVNVHVGAMVTDQGIITGRARETLLERKRLGARVAVVADVHVKHGTPMGRESIEQCASDTWSRGGVDGLIVSGTRTGGETSEKDIEGVCRVVPTAPVWIGSGVTPQNIVRLGSLANGVIVGTALHEGAETHLPISGTKTAELIALWRAATKRG